MRPNTHGRSLSSSEAPRILSLPHFALVILAALLFGRLSDASILPNFEPLIENNRPAVVNISVEREAVAQSAPDMEGMPEALRRFFEGQPGQPTPGPDRGNAIGSGFIIEPNGYILTNAHVVRGASEITVGLSDRRELRAELIGADARTDVALLKVEATGLPVVKIGNSDELKVGQWVLAIGRPFGFEHTATQGIVSGLSRSLPDDGYVPFIQTDVAVNPGNSGGPLFDLDGNVVGINSQIYSRTGGYMGVSFAIPVNLAVQVAEQLRESGQVSRGYLGINVQNLDQNLADAFGLDRPRGALVAGMVPNGPADRAGIHAGDVILEFDGHSIRDSGSLPPMVGSTPAGTEVTVKVLRSGDETLLRVTLGELDQPQELAAVEAESGGRLGVAVAPGTDESGVIVQRVTPGSAAASAGIQPQDELLTFNRESVTSAEQFGELVKEAPAGEPVAVLVKRGDGTRFTTVTLPEATG